ncbi:MAG: hypothetical protein IIB78_12950, partial [Proteobacteria bacterium]|nr:hypothetical protein [Pseudomonadota bacterium]
SLRAKQKRSEPGSIPGPRIFQSELEKIEKPAGIVNPKEYRGEVVNYVLRIKANNEGENPKWTSYEKLRTVIEKKIKSRMKTWRG